MLLKCDGEGHEAGAMGTSSYLPPASKAPALIRDPPSNIDNHIDTYTPRLPPPLPPSPTATVPLFDLCDPTIPLANTRPHP